MNNKGFTQIILVVIIALFALAYFNVDVRTFVENTPVLKQIFAIITTAWTDYLVPLGKFLWTSIVGLFTN